MGKQTFKAELTSSGLLMPFRKDELRFIYTGFMIMLLACFQGLDITILSIDDYILHFEEKDAETKNFMFAQGRAATLIGRALAYLFGSMLVQYTAVVTFLFFKAQLIFAAIIVFRVFKVPFITIPLALAGTLFIIHPYGIELLTFRTFSGFVSLSCCIIIAFAGWAVMSYGTVGFILGVLANTYLLATYQPLINMLLVFTILGFLYSTITRKDRENVIRNEFVIRGAGIFIALALSYLLYQYFKSITPSTDTRGSLVSSASLLTSLVTGFSVSLEAITPLTKGFLKNIVPPFSTVLTSAGLTLLFVNILIKITGNRESKGRAVNLVLVAILLPAAVLAMVGVNVLVNNYYGTRIVTGIASMVMSIFVLNEVLAFRPWIKHLSRAMLVLLCISYVITDNNIYASMKRISELDKMRANRMLYDIEKIPGFKDKPIVLYPVNSWKQYDKANVIMHGDMNVSAFFPEWSRNNLLRYVSGYDLKQGSISDTQYAKQYYESAQAQGKPLPLWPAPEGIVALPDKIIIYY
jgi:hypothetical protein